MTTATAKMQDSFGFRHTLATLAYRAAKVLRDVPAEFSGYRPAKDARSAGEILAHMCDLFDWALTQAQGKEKWRGTPPPAGGGGAESLFEKPTAVRGKT